MQIYKNFFMAKLTLVRRNRSSKPLGERQKKVDLTLRVRNASRGA